MLRAYKYSHVDICRGKNVTRHQFHNNTKQIEDIYTHHTHTHTTHTFVEIEREFKVTFSWSIH